MLWVIQRRPASPLKCHLPSGHKGVKERVAEYLVWIIGIESGKGCVPIVAYLLPGIDGVGNRGVQHGGIRPSRRVGVCPSLGPFGSGRSVGADVVSKHPLFDGPVNWSEYGVPGMVRMSNHTATFQSG